MSLESELSYGAEDDPQERDLGFVLAGLRASSGRHLRDEDLERRPIAVFVRKGRRIAGGVDGHTRWRWLYVSHLWVTDELRGEGVGRKLMESIEHEAERRGCVGSWLDTFDFQAPDFYEAIGYRRFGELPDFPPGGSRFFLWKRLDSRGSSSKDTQRT